MSTIRAPAVAGYFYPNEPAQLRASIAGYIANASISEPAPKAIIAPHAGYMYSGPIAGSAYARVRAAGARIECVVLLGPAHRVAFGGIALSGAHAFATPLGNVALDKTAHERLQDLPYVRVLDAAHAREHSLEVHLPFLQETLGDGFAVAALVVGDATPAQVAEVLERLWGGPETLIVVSSDLSHYHDYETAVALDRATSRAIEALDADAIDGEHACGCRPIGGLLYAARRKGMRAQTIDLRNSGDTSGARDRVVGYGAYVFQ